MDRRCTPGSNPGMIRFPAPIYMGGSVTLQAGAQGAPNPMALRAPDAYPIWIHSVQLGFRCTVAGGTTGTEFLASSANIGVQFTLGAFKVTNDFVPLGVFESVRPRYWRTSGVAGSNVVGFNVLWKLGSPLFVPSGAILLPTFKNFGQAPANDCTVFIRYNCSIAIEDPKGMLRVPYVAAWTGKSLPGNTADTDESDEDDLVNDADTPLHLDRLTGLLTWSSVDSAFSELSWWDSDTDDGGFGSGGSGQLVQLRARDSSDNAIIEQFTAWDAVFPYQYRALPVSGVVLDPHKFLKIYVNKLAPADTLSDTNRIQPTIAMHGYREVRWR